MSSSIFSPDTITASINYGTFRFSIRLKKIVFEKIKRIHNKGATYTAAVFSCTHAIATRETSGAADRIWQRVGTEVMLRSTTILVENRNNAIPFNKFSMTRKSTKTIYYLTKLLIGVFYAASITFFIPANQEDALFEVLRRLSCPSQEFFTASNIFVLCIDEDYIQFLATFTAFGVMLEVIQILFYFACCVYYLFFSARSFTSKTTSKLQIKFFASVLLQTLVPLLFLFPTAFYAWFAVRFNYYNQALTNLSILYASIHGLISTLTVLIIHSPYRKFILSLSRKTEPKQFVRNIEMESVMNNQIVIR
nr:hypothetical protein C44C3.4 - Caenorhabditis elegans [Caenorhabditis elegans]